VLGVVDGALGAAGGDIRWPDVAGALLAVLSAPLRPNAMKPTIKAKTMTPAIHAQVLSAP
jgi:hypothetical protein